MSAFVLLGWYVWQRQNTAPKGRDDSKSLATRKSSGTRGKSRDAARHKQASSRPGQPGSFLESFGSPAKSAKANTDVKSNEALEGSFRKLLAAMDERAQLRDRMFQAVAAQDRAGMIQLRSASQALSQRLNKQLSGLEGELKRARQSRPDDPLVQWLTGELLMHVGGEPAEMLPYFERAVKGGLVRARLTASLARVQFEANQFAAAYKSALQAFTLGEPDKYTWETYDRVARGNERFDELVKRLDAAFPDPQQRPAWEADMRKRAARLARTWKRERIFRDTASQRNDLPRVRLTIEHRRFARDGDGHVTSKVESTGRGEVTLELFEDQAPQTVANFVSLVEKGFYDRTLFMVAESASYVRGGDPKTRNDDPSDDGQGGPGYTIPDEFQRLDARDHFRGSLSMVNTGPHTAGSQFFIALAPNLSFNRHFTVFGRVIRGQEHVDGITPGRTTRNIGHFGKLVPGDVLLKAEVVRKRKHAYTATRE